MADLSQMEIRYKKEMLDSVLACAQKAKDEANELYGLIESQHLTNLRTLQESCSHPNRTEDQRSCVDCGYFFDISAA